MNGSKSLLRDPDIQNALEAQPGMNSTIEIPAPVTSTACSSGSTISTHVNFEQNCN